MTVILFCFGLIFPFFQKYYLFENVMPVFFFNVLSYIFSTFIIILIPLTIIVFKNVNGSNHIYFYTINSNENITEIKTFPVRMNHEVSVNIDQVYLFNEIMWNIDNSSHNNITNNNIKLVFCDNSFKCDNLNIKNALKIEFDSNKELRQSSPTSFGNIGKSGTQFSISELYNSAKESGHVYFSYSEPTIEQITQLVKCSKSLSISINEIGESDQNNCKQEKFLNYENKIVERKCLKFKDQIVPLDIICGRNQQLNKFTFFKENSFIKKNYLNFPTGLGEIYCCLNSSHFLEFYGECSHKLSMSYFDKRINDYETPDCPIHKCRKHSLFFKPSSDCLVSLSALTECNDDSQYIDCDSTSFACNDIVH